VRLKRGVPFVIFGRRRSRVVRTRRHTVGKGSGARGSESFMRHILLRTKSTMQVLSVAGRFFSIQLDCVAELWQRWVWEK
jgi:hypothetical protein